VNPELKSLGGFVYGVLLYLNLIS